jgi:hypothetical protein
MSEVKLYHSGRLQTGNRRHRFEPSFTMLMVFIGFSRNGSSEQFRGAF